MLATLAPQRFIREWRQASRKKRSAVQESFELGRLAGSPSPVKVAPTALDPPGRPHDLKGDQIPERYIGGQSHDHG